MVDSVGTVSVQISQTNTGARSAPATTVATTDAASVIASESSQNFVSSAIRVDNLQNVAILEFRRADGEIVQQYPTQTQIDAFTKARSLERHALMSGSPPAQQPHETPAPVTHDAEPQEASPPAADAPSPHGGASVEA